MAFRSGHDKVFAWITGLLVLIGIFVFVSAILGLLARSDPVNLKSALANQLGLGLVLGLTALVMCYLIPIRYFRKYAVLIFLVSLVATLLVFVPGLGLEHGGAKRWILLGPFSFQPSEALKLGFVIYFAAWLAARRERIGSLTDALIPLIVILGLVAAVLLAEPDTGTFAVILAAGLGMFIVGGGKWKHLFILLLLGVAALGVLAYTRPYVAERLLTFVDLTKDPLGSSYQIRQALIGIGSGEIFGRGFGQSIQKFNFLPEPVGDSIFAVIGEEFGFVGSTVIVLLFLAFALRGFTIASRAGSAFPRLLTVGIVILISSQSFLNIGAMVGLIPLTGVPLLFISQGGTALLFALAEVGIVLNISRGR